MDLLRVRPDGAEELLASGLSSEEIDELRDWFCYTTPMASSMKIVARSIRGAGPCFSVVTAGLELEHAEIRSPELALTR